MSSKITFWKLTKPLPFKGKPGLIEALRIVRIDNLTRSDCTIVYEEGWCVKPDDQKSPDAVKTADAETVDSFVNPSGDLKTWRWNDQSFAVEKTKNLKDLAASNANLTREMDQLALYYLKLGLSRSEYAGALVVQDAV